MKIFLQWVIRFFLPYTCCLCQAICQKEQNDICTTCEQVLHFQFSICIICNREINNDELTLCGTCIKKPPSFDTTTCIGPYHKELRYLVTQFKFHEKLFIGKLLSKILIKKLSASFLPECLIPVPLHPKRLSERGYNQSLEIALSLSKYLSIPIDKKLCQRLRYTAPQSKLRGEDRRKNVKNAFILREKCKYKHVAIVDDVLTTGQTVEEVAKLLKQHGVKKVEIWCLART